MWQHSPSLMLDCLHFNLHKEMRKQIIKGNALELVSAQWIPSVHGHL